MVLVAAVLPWAVASPSGLGGSADPPAVRERAAAIESFARLLVVTADRPAAIALKRTDGARAPWATPAGRSTVHPPLGLAHFPWPAVPIERSVPLALHLAGRGPPPASET